MKLEDRIENEDQSIFSYSTEVIEVAWSPDGSLLAVTHDSFSIENFMLINGSSFTIIFDIQLGEDPGPLAWKPDGSLLAIGTVGSLYLLNTTTWEVFQQIEGFTYESHNIKWSPDGQFLSFASSGTNIVIMEVATWTLSQNITAHDSSITTISWSPNGKKLASATNNKELSIWNTTDWDRLQNLTEQDSFIEDIAWSPDGKSLLAGARLRYTRIWNTTDWNMYHELNHRDVRSLSFSNNSKYLASLGGGDTTIKIWKTDSWELNQTWTGHRRTIFSGHWNPNDKLFASGSTSGFSLKIWNATLFPPKPDAHFEPVNDVSVSNNNDLIASGGEDQVLKIWNTSSMNLITDLTNHTNEIISVSWSHDSTILISSARDGFTYVWNTSNWKIIKTLNKIAYSISWHPNGSILALGTNSAQIALYETETWTNINNLSGHSSGVTGLSWSKNSSLLASAGAKILIWNATTFTPIQTLDRHSALINDVSWSPDGGSLASASDDSTALIWNTTTWTITKNLTDFNLYVNVATFNDAGSLLFIGGYYNKYVIETSNWTIIHSLTGSVTSPARIEGASWETNSSRLWFAHSTLQGLVSGHNLIEYQFTNLNKAITVPDFLIEIEYADQVFNTAEYKWDDNDWNSIINGGFNTPSTLGWHNLSLGFFEKTNTFQFRFYITSNFSDYDGDGMPNEWELQNNLDIYADDSGLDPDEDGHTNLEEYIMGTDPHQPNIDSSQEETIEDELLDETTLKISGIVLMTVGIVIVYIEIKK